MRNRDVFGRKIRHINFVYLLVFLFAAVFALRFAIVTLQENRLERLAATAIELQNSIDSLLAAEDATTYHEIGAILPSLPNEYNQIQIADELDYVRDRSGMANAVQVEVVFREGVASPFDQPLAATVKYIRIDLSMTVADVGDILVFLDELLALDRLYYVDDLAVSYLEDGGADVTLVLYTFYNDVVL
ncbi:MAG: hypothetical protein V1761_04810 [bacterium]